MPTFQEAEATFASPTKATRIPLKAAPASFAANVTVAEPTRCTPTATELAALGVWLLATENVGSMKSLPVGPVASKPARAFKAEVKAPTLEVPSARRRMVKVSPTNVAWGAASEAKSKIVTTSEIF